jgi:hypothetical protein
MASVIRNDKLNKVFEDISARKVPSDFSLNSQGSSLGFADWLSHRISGDPRWIENADQAHLIELVVEEAHMLRERGAINAFKHGKPFSFGKGFKATLTSPETRESVSNIQLDGINWVEWTEKRETLSIGFFAEEIIPEDDKKRIFIVSMLNSAVRDVRLAQINGDPITNVNFPSDFKTGLQVRRQNLRLKVSAKQEGVK